MRLPLAAALIFLTPACRAAVPAVSVEWNRFSVLTPPGPEEPGPEIFRGVRRLLYGQHKILPGEYSAWKLAKLYGTSVMSLQTTNSSELFVLNPGMKVTVHNKEGMLYKVKDSGENLDRVMSRFYGPNRGQKLKLSIVEMNRLPGSALFGNYELPPNSRLVLPKISMSFDTYHFPFMTQAWPRVSSRFGSRYHPVLKRRKVHEGLDLPKPWGTPVVPARSGQVMETGWHEGYGLLVVLRHSDGWTTRYGHLSKILVKPGQLVQRGKTVIANVGSTGISTGPHLHFEVRDKNGRPVNPGAKFGRR